MGFHISVSLQMSFTLNTILSHQLLFIFQDPNEKPHFLILLGNGFLPPL